MGAAATGAQGLVMSTSAGARTQSAVQITENNTTGTVATVDIDSSSTRGGIFDIDTSGAFTNENLIDITTGAQAWTSNLIDVNVGAGAATGDVINIDLGATAVDSQAMVIGNTASARTASMIEVNDNNTTGTVATFDLNGAGTRGGLFDIDWTGALTTENLIDITADAIQTSGLFAMSADGLTTGNALYVESTSTGLADGSLNGALGRFAWNPGSADTTDADLFVIDVNGNATVTGNLFAVYDNGSDVFTVSQTQIESAVPHSFTAAGDVSFSYDAIFTNQTASQIESYGPFTIDVGESFESNNLTLNTYNYGNILLTPGGTSGGNVMLQDADPSIIFDVATATDTDFWIGVDEDAGGDDDDFFQIGDGTTPGTNAFLTITTTGQLGIGADVIAPAGLVEIDTGTADLIALTIDQDDVDQTALDLDINNTSGDILNIDWGGATSQSGGDILGIDIDLTNLTPDGTNNLYGIHINDPASQTNSTEYGLYQQGTNLDIGILAEAGIGFGAQQTLADADATPDISGGTNWITGSTSFTITDFDAGTDSLAPGQFVVIESNGDITFDVTSSGLSGGTTDIVTATGDVTTWQYDGTDWKLIAFMDASTDQGGGSAGAFSSSGGVITKSSISDYLSLRYGDAGDTQFELENTTNNTIPTVDAAVINLTGNTTGIVTDGVDALYIAGEFGNSAGAVTESLLHLNLDTVNTPSGDETLYAINIDGTAGSSASETAINIGSGWDTGINMSGNVDILFGADSATPIDIGADVFETGTLVDIAFDSAETQTGALTGLNLDFSNLTSVAGSTTYGLHIEDLAAQTTSTEYAIYQQGTNWDYGIYAEDNVFLASTLDTGTVMKIDNSDADLAGNTSLLDLEFTDNSDENAYWLRGYDTNGSVLQFALKQASAGYGAFQLGSEATNESTPLSYLHIGDSLDGGAIGTLVENTHANGFANLQAMNDGGGNNIASFGVGGSTTTANVYGNRGYVSSSANLNGLSLIAAGSGDDIRLFTGGEATTNERMRIEGDGGVVVGNTSTTALFEVDVGSTDAVTGFLLDTDDTDQIAMQITAAQIDADVLDIQADALTTAQGIQLSVDALTTGNAMYVESTSTGLADGSLNGALGRFAWNPGSADTTDADLFVIDVNGNATVTGNLFAVYNNGSDVFTVSQTGITSAVPHAFTASGDVSMAYDLVFTNQTSSNIKTDAPFTIDVGEASESNNLTLKTYNSGDIVFDLSAEGTAIVQGGFSLDAQQTLTADSATPDVSAGSHWITANTSGTAYTNFTDGTDGQIIIVEVNDANSTIECDGTPTTSINCGSTDITLADGDVITFALNSSTWNLISFMDDSDNHNTGSGFDLAEYFVSTEELEEGDVVKIDPNETVRIHKAREPYDPTVIGIISTQPGLILGDGGEENSYLVALAGRVPVHVDPDSPSILAGDFLTSSENGQATKAIDSGHVIGQAMESWTAGSGIDQIMLFINPGWHESDVLFAINTFGDISAQQEQIELNLDQALQDLDNLAQQSTDQTDEIQTIEDILETHSSDIAGLATTTDELQTEVATQSGQLSEHDQRIADLEANLVLFEQFLDLAQPATSSGTPTGGDLNIDGIALVGDELQIDHDLRLLGKAVLEDTTILGTLNVGFLQIDDIDTSINALAQDLKLQSLPLAGNIDAFNGKIVLTPQGDISIEGRITAKEVTAPKAGFGDLVAGKLTIATQSAVLAVTTEATGSSQPQQPPAQPTVQAPSIGSATLPANQRSIYVQTSAVTKNSKIFITPAGLTQVVLGVTLIDEGQGFWVETPVPATADLKFNWWIIDVVATASQN